MNYPPAKDRRVSCATGASEVSCFNWPLLFRSIGRSSTGGSSARRSGNSTAVSPVRGVPSLFRILIPSSRILQAAFGSRSMTAPQCGHTHTRSLSLSSLYMPPQWLHILELGKNLPTFTKEGQEDAVPLGRHRNARENTLGTLSCSHNVYMPRF